ncbi:MAG: sulfotransferase [Planctomycetota bacterium]
MSQPGEPGRIAFLTGCGRSGTTILGRLINAAPSVRYLNDQFDLWIGPFPRCDAWGLHPDARESGPIELTEADADPAGIDAFWRGIEAERGNAPLVLEKVALNNFRLRFLRAIAPDARIVSIVRHGVEVARSIGRRIECGQWYGDGDRKWHALQDLARARGLGDLLPHCATPTERGLLEWRLSVEVAAEHLAAIGNDRVLRVHYEDLLADPDATMAAIAGHLGIPSDAEHMQRKARELLGRQNPSHAELHPPREAERIAGGALRALGYELEAPDCGAMLAP